MPVPTDRNDEGDDPRATRDAVEVADVEPAQAVVRSRPGQRHVSRPPTITRLLDAFDRWHVDYYAVTVGGVPWHKRTSAGRWSDLIGIVDHHTATSATRASLPNVLALLAKGRPGLGGPLCHFAPDPFGRLALIGWLNANHAGQLHPRRRERRPRRELRHPPA